MFYLEILKKQEIGRRIYKETGRLPMFLFRIPFELSWKHKGIIKQWLFKYFFVFLSVSLSCFYCINILGHCGQNLLCLDMSGMSQVDPLLLRTKWMFVKKIDFSKEKKKILTFLPISKLLAKGTILFLNVHWNRYVSSRINKSCRSARMWGEYKS